MHGDNILPYSALAMAQPMVENLINRFVQMDLESETRLKSLEGTLVMFEIHGVPDFLLLWEKGRVRLQWEAERRSDITIRAVLPDAIRAISLLPDRPFRFEKNCEIIGDPDTTRLVLAFFASFQPDWEEQLSRIVGDTLARKAGQFVQLVAGWVQESSNSVAHNVREYLQQERLMLATRPRLDRFLSDIQLLEQETNGLERRLQACDRQTGKD
jgi:ubiquinone biosynthesis protein UbiJ